MRRILTHPVTLFLLVVVVASILLSGSKPVSGFSRFGLRTAKKNTSVQNNEYIKQQVNTSVIQDVIKAHTVLGAGTLYGDLSKVATVSSIPQYIAASQRILMIDIVSYLENTSDKEAGLDSLIGQMTYYQNQGAEIQTQLQDTIQTKTLDMNQCASQKEEGDRNFYQGLREGDAGIMMEGLETSKKGGGCQAEAKIDINAHTVMQKRVAAITTTMNNVSSLLTTNRQTVLANFGLFKDTYLEKLLSLRNSLRAQSPGTQ